MSVATQHSPFAVGTKRGLYESEENEDRLQRLDSTSASQAKRYRARGSPLRCGSGPGVPDGFAYSVGHTTHVALRALFPEMSDKVGFLLGRTRSGMIVLREAGGSRVAHASARQGGPGGMCYRACASAAGR